MMGTEMLKKQQQHNYQEKYNYFKLRHHFVDVMFVYMCVCVCVHARACVCACMCVCVCVCVW